MRTFVGQEALNLFPRIILRRFIENRKLHYKTTFQKLPISIENRKGSIRRGTDEDGDEWKTRMKRPYGYIPGTEGADGDALDVFVGANEDAAFAYIVHCNTPDGEQFDEDKIMLGFNSSKSAKQCFMQHYDDPKFFGGIERIPMWKFSDKAFVKKHTTKKLVASVRESEGASLQVPREMFEKKLDTLGRGTDQEMKKTILGKRHQPIMVNPEVREGGPGSGRHKDLEKRINSLVKSIQITKDPAGKKVLARRLENLRDEVQSKMGEAEEHGVSGMHWGTRSAATMHGFVPDKRIPGKFDKGVDSVIVHGDGRWSHISLDTGTTKGKGAHELSTHLGKQSEAEEHGVKGMKWGVTHARHDSAGQKGAGGKAKPANKRDLASDPKTLSMMQVVHNSQGKLNQVSQQQKQEKAQGKVASPQRDHARALDTLKELGWKVAEVASKLTGTEGLLNSVRSVVKSPAGQKLFMNTDREGNHKLTLDKQGRSPASKSHEQRRTRTSRTFESRMGAFLREAKRVYYARSLGRYGTDAEESDVDMIREANPGAKVDFPRTRRHAELGMGFFHEKIDKADRVVIKPTRRRRLTAGVFSEAVHALKKKIPVYAIHKGRMRRVASVEALGKPNREGHFGKVIFKKKKRK